MSKVRFSFLTGDMNWSDYGGKWISQKFNNGEFDYYLVREIINMDEVCGFENDEEHPKYHCQLSLVAPTKFKDMERALSSCGFDCDTEDLTDRDKVEAIHAYSGGAMLWQEVGNNYSTLFKECQKEANLAIHLTGFYLDRQQNAIGDTGWNAIAGSSVIDSWQ